MELWNQNFHLSRSITDNEDDTHKIQVGWLKWTKALGFIWDRKEPTKLKKKIYHIVIHSTTL
uniref:Uncharacterized protein n=1 Tax=Cajanus cajan TaxID=3821 RepID=A0A151SL51_CAJCA|nr:hypothetical protein KK1_001730 [Cajanus cajan]